MLHGFEQVLDSRDGMRAIALDDGEAEVFARSALVPRVRRTRQTLPITESQILRPVVSTTPTRTCGPRSTGSQENLVKGGLTGRSANGRQQRTRPVQGIDKNVRLNRALWLFRRRPAQAESLTPKRDRVHRGMVRFYSLVSGWAYGLDPACRLMFARPTSAH